MAKNSIPDFSATAASNTDIQSVNIDENCPASGINNAIRELMVDLKNVDTGAVALTSPQFATASMTGSLDLGDNNRIRLGSANDLQIYHDSANSYIQDTGTGDLIITSGVHRVRTDTFQLNNAANNAALITAANAGEAKLFHNGSAKIYSQSHGARIDGGVRFASSGAASDTSNPYIFRSSGADNMVFATGSNERARITASGHLLLGRDTETTNATLSILSDTTDRIVQTTSTGTDTQHHFFFANNSGTGVGTITCTTSGTSFVTSSDYRLKENVDYTWDATTRLKQLKPARFNFIADDTNTLVDGFLAHEVSSIVPEAINGTKDETRSVSNAVLSSTGELLAEGITQDEWTAGKDDTYPSDSTWTASHTEPVMQGIDQSKLVPLLVKTIQELEARIAALEA